MTIRKLQYPRSFVSLSAIVTDIAGHRITLAAMIAISAAWVVYGAVCHFSTEWFLISNLVGTLVALFVLLMIQNTKTRETLAVQAKIDQLILSSDAGNHWIGIERQEAGIIEEMRSKLHSNIEHDQ